VETARRLIREFSPSSKTYLWRPENDSPVASASFEPDGAPPVRKTSISSFWQGSHSNRPRFAGPPPFVCRA
jgi:hypothetical protein